MRGFLGGMLGHAGGTPLARAHDLVDQAFEEPAAGKQAGLAKQAPTPSPDRADA